MSQTSYTETHAVAFAGMKVDGSPATQDSLVNGEASAEIPFGAAVTKGTTDTNALLPDASNDVVIGIAMHSQSHGKAELGTTGIKPKVTFSVITKGRVWVKVEEAVVKGDLAYVRYASGAGGSQKGSFRKSADTSTALQLKGGRYLTSASANGMAQLEFDASVQAAV